MYYKRAGTEDEVQGSSEDLTASQHEAARRGFFGLLRRKMSHSFIERHGEDLFQQALFEYTRAIRAGKEIRKPVAWIVLCAWHRTVRELERRDWRPQTVSTDRVGEITAETTPAPEEDFLSEDRYRKVREAVEQLPEYQRELLKLSYFEGDSVREAARKLGWTPSKAQRAHEAAQRSLHKLLGVETSEELEIAAGLAALLTLGPDGCSRVLQVIGRFEGALDAVAHQLSQLGERGFDLLRHPLAHGGWGGRAPMSESVEALGEVSRRAAAAVNDGPVALISRAGRRASDFGRRLVASGGVETTAAAADGGARVAEACKAIAVVCVIGTGAFAGGSALFASGHHHLPSQPRNPRVASQDHRAAGSGAKPKADGATVTAPRASPTHAPAARSDAGTESATRASSGRQPTVAQRRAQRHRSEEANVEESFGGVSQAASEAQTPTSTASSGAVSSAEPQSSSGAGQPESSAAAPASSKTQAEEKQTKTQFQGGLP
jgi:RNA polymerase sigma factor (sigma-70 family)